MINNYRGPKLTAKRFIKDIKIRTLFLTSSERSKHLKIFSDENKTLNFEANSCPYDMVSSDRISHSRSEYENNIGPEPQPRSSRVPQGRGSSGWARVQYCFHTLTCCGIFYLSHNTVYLTKTIIFFEKLLRAAILNVFVRPL
jgi:hypothetical protein